MTTNDTEQPAALDYANTPDEQCDFVAPEGSRAWGNLCVLKRGHGDVHVYGTPKYERDANVARLAARQAEIDAATEKRRLARAALVENAKTTAIEAYRANSELRDLEWIIRASGVDAYVWAKVEEALAALPPDANARDIAHVQARAVRLAKEDVRASMLGRRDTATTRALDAHDTLLAKIDALDDVDEPASPLYTLGAMGLASVLSRYLKSPT